jgi:hypothetical protein
MDNWERLLVLLLLDAPKETGRPTKELPPVTENRAVKGMM